MISMPHNMTKWIYRTRR